MRRLQVASPPPSICTIATGTNAAAAQGLRGRKNRVDTICIFLMVIRYFQDIILPQNFLAPDRRRKRSRSSGKTFSIVWSNDPEGLGKRSRTFNQTFENVFREEREPSSKSSCIKKRNHSIICKNAFFQNAQLSGFANARFCKLCDSPFVRFPRFRREDRVLPEKRSRRFG